MKLSKSTERILLESVAGPGFGLVEGMILAAYEGLQDVDVANTFKKRLSTAEAIKHSMLAFLRRRQNSLDQTTPAQISAHMDAALCMGFLIGKYAQNNEILEPLAAQFRVHFQSQENPEIKEQIKKEHEKHFDEFFNKGPGKNWDEATKIKMKTEVMERL